MFKNKNISEYVVWISICLKHIAKWDIYLQNKNKLLLLLKMYRKDWTIFLIGN